MDLAAYAKMIKRPLLSELILGSTVRPCERCRQPTRWAKPRQKVKGFCPDHAVHDGPGFADALKAALRAFPGAGVDVDAPEIFAPGEYGQREVRVLMRGRFRQVRPTHLGRGDRPPAGRRPVRQVPGHGTGLWTRRLPILPSMQGVIMNAIHPGTLARIDQNYAALREKYEDWLACAEQMYCDHGATSLVAGSALNYLIDHRLPRCQTNEILAVVLAEYGRLKAGDR